MDAVHDTLTPACEIFERLARATIRCDQADLDLVERLSTVSETKRSCEFRWAPITLEEPAEIVEFLVQQGNDSVARALVANVNVEKRIGRA